MNTNICESIKCFYFNKGAYGCNRYHLPMACHLVNDVKFMTDALEGVKTLKNGNIVKIKITPYILYSEDECDKETIDLLRKENNNFFKSDQYHLQTLEIENRLGKQENIKMKLMYKNPTEHNLNLKEISLENNQLGIQVKTRGFFNSKTLALTEIETKILADFLREALDENLDLKITLNEKIERRGLEYEKMIYIEKERIN